MNKLRRQLLKAAKQKGMCEMGKEIIRHARDLDEILQQYHDHLGWHIENNNPPEDILREHFAGFSNDWAAADVKGVKFVDQDKVFMALAAEGEACYTPGHRGRVYLRQDAEVTIYAEPKTFVMVSAYDNARITIRPTDTARVYVYLHGNAQVVDTPDFPKQITIKHTEK